MASASSKLRYVKSDVQLEEITPTKAEKILNELNHNNRPIRPTVVDKYAKDMEQGNWKVTSDTIKFNGDGSLIDGQHRLAACVQAKVNFKTYVAHGIDSEAKEAIDTGQRRTFADVLAWKGETNANHLAAAIRHGYRWQNGFIFGERFGAFSHAEGLRWYSHNPSIRSTVGTALRLRNHLRIPMPATAALIHRINMIDAEQADAFIASLDIGEGLLKGDPVFALRTWLTNQMAKIAQTRPNADFYLAMLIKTWNFWALGDDDVSMITFKRGGTFKERMPQLVDFEGRLLTLEDELDEPVDIPVPEEYR